VNITTIMVALALEGIVHLGMIAENKVMMIK
jgi:hypothetical protein